MNPTMPAAPVAAPTTALEVADFRRCIAEGRMVSHEEMLRILGL